MSDGAGQPGGWSEPLSVPLLRRHGVGARFKSLTNRALVCAALATGTTTCRGCWSPTTPRPWCRACAAGGGRRPGGRHGLAEVVGVRPGGSRRPHRPGGQPVGTCARFLLPVLGIGPGPYRLDGAAGLRARPMSPAITALRHLGVGGGRAGCTRPPAGGGRGHATAGSVAAPGSFSSQFVSGLLLAAPCYREGLELQLADALVSTPYVADDRGVMAAFGARGEPSGRGSRRRVGR